MPKFASDLTKLKAAGANDGRLDVAAFHTNSTPILRVLEQVFAPTLSGDVIEIGSGSGQHINKFATAFPALVFWPTDPNRGHRRSIDAWRNVHGAENVRPASDLDALDTDWKIDGLKLDARSLVGLICINVMHITPWAVSEVILSAAGRLLRSDGHLIVYGPFARDGQHTAPSNEEFDLALRNRNADWGVRDVADVTRFGFKNRLVLKEIFEMPANNLMLDFVLAADGLER